MSVPYLTPRELAEITGDYEAAFGGLLMTTHQAIQNKIADISCDSITSIAETLIENEREIRELQDQAEGLLTSIEKLLTGIRRIADDYHPDSDDGAPLALQEMRDALFVLADMS